MGTVYEFLNKFSNLSGTRVWLYDQNSDDIVFDSRDYQDEDPVRAVIFQGLSEYEIGGVDLYRDSDGFINLEMTIEFDWDEE